MFPARPRAGLIDNNMLTVAYACDDNYAALTAVSAVSLLRHNPGARVILFGCRLSADAVDLVRTRVERAGGRFQSVDVSPLVDSIRQKGLSGYVSYAVYSRIYIADLLPDENGRILYVDCDTLVTDSLKDLFDVDMGGRPVALGYDCVCKAYYRYIRLPEGKPYFNSGVMLIDLPKWRETECTKRITDEMDRPQGPNPLGDQDIIVRALNDLTCPLAPRWNFLSQYFLFSYRGIRRVVGAQWASAAEFEQARKRQSICHFSGNTLGRPWQSDSKHPMSAAYREAAIAADVRERVMVFRKMAIEYRLQYWLWKLLPQPLFDWVGYWMLRTHVRLTYGV